MCKELALLHCYTADPKQRACMPATEEQSSKDTLLDAAALGADARCLGRVARLVVVREQHRHAAAGAIWAGTPHDGARVAHPRDCQLAPAQVRHNRCAAAHLRAEGGPVEALLHVRKRCG